MGWMLQGRSRESYFSKMLFNSKCTLNKPIFSPSPRKAAQTESNPSPWLQYLLPGTGRELSVPPARTVQIPSPLPLPSIPPVMLGCDPYP